MMIKNIYVFKRSLLWELTWGHHNNSILLCYIIYKIALSPKTVNNTGIHSNCFKNQSINL